MATIAIQTKYSKVIYPLQFKDALDNLGAWEHYVEEKIITTSRMMRGHEVDYTKKTFNLKPFSLSAILITSIAYSETKQGYEYWKKIENELFKLEKDEI